MDEMSEIERLRARVAELESDRAPAGAGAATGTGPAGHSGWRAPVSAIMIILACVLAPLSVASVWTSTMISDTNRYVDTVAPVIDSPAVQSALTTQVTAAVMDNLDVQTLTTQTLQTIARQPNVPPRVAASLPALAVPLVNGIEGFTRDQVAKVLASPQFAQVWDQVNRTAHTQVVKLLEGNQGGAVTTQGDTVTLNLAPIVAEVKARLVSRGFGLANNIPTVNRSFVLAQSSSISRVQGFYQLLNTLGVWLPIVTLALLVGGVATARDRRRTVLRGALGVVAGMVVLGVLLALARMWYVNTTPGNVLSATAAGDVFDTLVRFLRTSLRALAVAGLLVALAAFLAGPSTAALRTRATFTQGLGSARAGAESSGWNTGRFGTWTFAHRRALQLTTLVLAGLALMFWTSPTAWVVVGVALAAVLVLALIEFLGTPPAPVVAEGTAAAATPMTAQQVSGAAPENDAARSSAGDRAGPRS
jgi:hypothetical protein